MTPEEAQPDSPTKASFSRRIVVEWIFGACADLRRNLWALAACDLFFKLMVALVLAPFVTWALSHLISAGGRLSLTNDEIVDFLLSPAGLLWLLVGGAAAQVIALLEMAGMMTIAREGWTGRRCGAAEALWMVLRRLDRMFLSGLRYVATQVLILLPFLLAGALFYRVFLAQYDIYYLVSEQPPIWWAALGLGGVLGLAALFLLLRLALRWALVFAEILFGGGIRTSISRGPELLSNLGATGVWTIILGALSLALLPVLLALLFDELGELLTGLLPPQGLAALGGIALYTLVYALLSVAATFVAGALASLGLARIHATAAGAAPENVPSHPGRGFTRRLRRRLWLFTVVLLVGMVAAMIGIFHNMDLEDRVAVTAHRGSSMRAPENTLAALEAASEDGADWAEIDVQELADGTVVLIHDEDLLRIAGDRRKISELSSTDLAEIDAGSWFSEDFRGERLPTLREAIHLAGNRLRLNVELKLHRHEKRLAERVVEILREEEFSQRAVITSLSYPALRRVRAADPEIPIGYIVFESVAGLDRLDMDFVSVAQRLATRDFIVRAHRQGREVHVWTINDPREMSRLIDLGADNLITDLPELAVGLLDERSEMPEAALLLIKVRSLLWRKPTRPRSLGGIYQ